MKTYFSYSSNGKTIGWNVMKTRTGDGEFPESAVIRPRKWEGWVQVDLDNPRAFAGLMRLFAESAGISMIGKGRWRFVTGLNHQKFWAFHWLIGVALGIKDHPPSFDFELLSELLDLGAKRNVSGEIRAWLDGAAARVDDFDLDVSDLELSELMSSAETTELQADEAVTEAKATTASKVELISMG